jgi:osmotically-inducible protein OsmY
MSVFAETPVDQPIAQAIRQAMASNRGQFQNLRNINISSSNGVVTISGSVANQQEQDRIIGILHNINGVRRINNQIEVRP